MEALRRRPGRERRHREAFERRERVGPRVAADEVGRLGPQRTRVPTGPAFAPLLRSARTVLWATEWERLRSAAAEDEEASRTVFAALHDPTALVSERNILRYLPASVVVRVEDAGAWDVLREASAAIAAGADVRFSARGPLADGVAEALGRVGFALETAGDDEFDATAAGRIRHLGTRDLLADLGGPIDVTVYPGPALPGRLACLPYLREQTVSVTAHRFGHPRQVL